MTPRWRSAADRGGGLYSRFSHSDAQSVLPSLESSLLPLRLRKTQEMASACDLPEPRRSAKCGAAPRRGKFREIRSLALIVDARTLSGTRSPGTGTGMPVCCGPSKAHNNS